MGHIICKGYRNLLPIGLLCLGLLCAACGGGEPGANGVTQLCGSSSNLATGLASLPSVSTLAKHEATIAETVEPTSYFDNLGATDIAWDGEGCVQLLPAEAGACAWAMYSMPIPESYVFTGLYLDVDDADLEDEEWVPALPYYVGVANFAEERWEWLGPYEDFMATPEVDSSLPRGTYVNENNAAVCVLLSYCPPEAEPSVTTLVYIDSVYEDNTQ